MKNAELNHCGFEVQRWHLNWPSASYSRIYPLSSFLDGFQGYSIYCLTILSVIWAALHRPSPIAQQWLPQERFFKCRNSTCKSRQMRPRRRLTKSERASFGGHSMCIGTWSYYARQDADIFGIANLRQQIAATHLYIAFQNVIAVLCCPNQMDGQSRNSVMSVPVFFHLPQFSHGF